MKDGFGRTINYLRISVTDLCNLRCTYCMPPEGVKQLGHEDILSFEEITELTGTAVGMGITKVRITGGEPLVRRGIRTLVRMLAGIEGVEDLAMSTNGTLLGQHAGALAEAGLHRVNISLDTLDPSRYAEITRGGDVRQVLDGIEAAQQAQLFPIKINCVVVESSDETDAREVAEFARTNDLEIRFIHKMNTGTGAFSVVEGGSGGDCSRCNRLRLSSDGLLRPCLFSDIGFDVRQLGPVRALQLAVRHKPQAGGPCNHNWMYGIGG